MNTLRFHWRLSLGILTKGVVSATFLTLLACGGGSGESNGAVQEESKTHRFVFYGDSLTEGYTLPIDDAYPALLQSIIAREGLRIEILNAGVSGDTSADGLARLPETLGSPIDLFFLALGANDGLRGVDPIETEANLRAIIDRVREANPGVTVILAGMRVLREGDDNFAETFASLFPRLAETEVVPLYPFLLSGIYGEKRFFLPDGLHPNAEGHSIMAQSIHDFLLPYFPGTPKLIDGEE